MYKWLLARWRRRQIPKSLLLLLGLVLLLGVGAAAFFQATGSRSGEGLRINLGVPPSTLDPQRAESEPAQTIIKQCLQGLFEYDEKLFLRPAVAQNFSVSPDGLNYTFLIKEQARWQDGKRVTAQDFLYSFQRLLAPGSPYAGLYLDIKGAAQYRALASTGSLPGPEALGVQAVGDRTLHITLERPVNHFLHLLTLLPTYPVRRDIIEQYGDKWARPKTYPCNGPFVLQEWTADRIILERNKKFWGEKPRLGRIQAFFVEAHLGPAEKEYQAYKDGDLDIIDVILAPGAGTEKERKEWQRRPNAHTAGILFNTQSPPFDNVKVRQAVATALNRDRFITENLAGTGKGALSWIPPQFPEHEPNLGQAHRFDLSRAKDLLREAGYPSGQGLPALAFQYEDNRTGKIISQFVADALSGLGLTVEVEPMKPEDLQRALKDKRFTFTYFSTTVDFYHIAGWFVPYFKSDGAFNYSGYTNSKVDQLIQQAEGTRDPLEELRLWRQVHQQVVADVPIAPFFHEERTFLMKSQVKGLVVTPIDGAAPGDSFFSQVRLGR